MFTAFVPSGAFSGEIEITVGEGRECSNNDCEYYF